MSKLKSHLQSRQRAPRLSCPATARTILSGTGPPLDFKQISSSSSRGPILPGSRGHYPTAQQLPRERNCFHPSLSASHNPEDRPWQSADSQVARVSVNYIWPLAKARTQSKQPKTKASCLIGAAGKTSPVSKANKEFHFLKTKTSWCPRCPQRFISFETFSCSKMQRCYFNTSMAVN